MFCERLRKAAMGRFTWQHEADSGEELCGRRLLGECSRKDHPRRTIVVWRSRRALVTVKESGQAGVA